MKECVRWLMFVCCLVVTSLPLKADPPPVDISVLRRDNLLAWCIVPYDAANRTPAARAQMLKELGLKRCAYDWRMKHIVTFEQEILEYRKHGIEMFAFWSEHEEAFRLLKKYDLHPQIWRTIRIRDPKAPSRGEKVAQAVQSMVPLAERTKQMGCVLGLYNHGGWAGEPENLVAVCRGLRELGHDHVGIVYNFHHAHNHINNWAETFALLKPYLLCLNLNGMANPQGRPKILSLGRGQYELEMIRVVVESGYDGPIGILGHRPKVDARESLQENLDGLQRIRLELQKPGNAKRSNVQDDQVSDKATHLEGQAAHHRPVPVVGESVSPQALPYDPALAVRLVRESKQRGDAVRGAAVFASAKSACLSCHRVGRHGGTVGPDLTVIAKQRAPPTLVESLFWPQREVKPEYRVWHILTTDGQIVTGYKQVSDDDQIVLREPASGKSISISHEDVEEENPGTTPMPANLTAAMSQQQQRDLIRFLCELGDTNEHLSDELDHALTHAQMHGPATFPLDPAPVDPSRWPHSTAPVNRDRLYDFYTKQADYFRSQDTVPMLLAPFPGLDGGQKGHWGNQPEERDGRWNDSLPGSVQCGILRAGQLVVRRAVCVRLGDQGELSACFNPDTLTYDAVWTDGFVSFSPIRHGFLDGIRPQGRQLTLPKVSKPNKPFTYHGFYRHGVRVVFSYRIGDEEFLDTPWVEDGQLVREVAPVDQHSMRGVIKGGSAQWPEILETQITPGNGRPYAVDTIELPVENPWNALLFCGDHDFLPDGSAMVCTMQGDVWHVTGLDSAAGKPGIARWRRFASGLNHALGLVVADGSVYVQGRDQLTRLHDVNGDGEADFYECFCNSFQTSAAGHNFICGLERDERGYFYTASGNQGLVRISPDGRRADIVATGLRNPDGLGLLPDGTVTVPCSEGDWTPASMICAVQEPAHPPAKGSAASAPPHYGFGGPRAGQPPKLPLAYLPRGLDNSSGGQVFVDSDAWGPLKGQLLHLSFGMGSWFVVLRDEVDGQQQGAVVPMTGDFRSGVHRGRFHPNDGQLYVSGMDGWVTFTPDDGCFQRVRYTGGRVQVPIAFHLHENGVHVTFAGPINPAIAEDVRSHFAQCWNYRYSGAYGSPEFSTSHPGTPGHDPLEIASAHVLSDGRSLFLEIPDLQPVSQLHLRLNVNDETRVLSCSPAGQGHDLFITAHKLDSPFVDFPGYEFREKTIAAHPLLVDMALNAKRVPNPWRKRLRPARPIEIETAKNLTYATREIRVRANETIAFTLSNPDVVPHNWVLVRPGALQRVGEAANRLIADPEAFARHYVPRMDDVLAYTDIVSPGSKQTIYFRAPSATGRYPFVCTFPGHWMVMNGVMIVN